MPIAYPEPSVTPVEQVLWGALDLFRKMDDFECALIVLLAIMLAHVVAIMSGRIFRYRTAWRQSHGFVRDSRDAFLEERYAEAISIAARYKKSHIAVVVAAGLTASLQEGDPVEMAERSLRRAQRRVSAELRAGLSTLSNISGTAPFIGLLGTVYGILNSFVAWTGSRSAYLSYVTARLATSLAMTGAGLLVAILAVWCRNYLRERLEAFDTEMSNAELDTVSYVKAHREWHTSDITIAVAATTSIFEADSSASPLWEVHYDRPRLLMLIAWFCALINGLVLAFALFGALIGSFLPARPYHQDPPRWVSFGEQDAVSPDGHYRATVPGVVRERLDWPEEKFGLWSCWPGARVALRIIPNDRPRTWVRQNCGPATEHYELESGDVLMTKNCKTPVIMWRTNEELLVHCYGCSVDEVDLMGLKSFPRNLTVLGSDGKRLKLHTVAPQQRCY